jgi:FMN phosphatase YigB (HAD superfamily)
VSKAIRAVLFDLDDTLLENDMHRFVKAYFGLLTPHMAHLVPPKQFVSALFHATSAMIQNGDPAATNQQVFIDHFFPRVGRRAEEMMPLFDDFYAGQYGTLRSLTRPSPSARAAVQTAIDMGCDVVLATNPIFPETAIRQRMEWADISDFPFKLVTSYEVMHSAKPNLHYYMEILSLIDRCPEECIMVGDDWGNDMVPATKAGMQVFWVHAATDSTNAVDPPARGTLDDFGDWFRRGCRSHQAYDSDA